MTPRRPRPLDAVLVGALVLIVAGVVFLQLHLGGDKNAGKASPSPSPTYLQTSVGNPYPDPTPTGVPSTPQASSSAASAASSAESAASALQSSLAAQAQSLQTHVGGISPKTALGPTTSGGYSIPHADMEWQLGLYLGN